MTGMFVQSQDLASPGTTISFEFNARDFQRIFGLAEVMWVRELDRGPQQPRGMGLRFVRLDGAGSQVIRRRVEKDILEGASLADLDALMEMPEEELATSVQRTAASPVPPELGEWPHAPRLRPAAAASLGKPERYAAAAVSQRHFQELRAIAKTVAIAFLSGLALAAVYYSLL